MAVVLKNLGIHIIHSALRKKYILSKNFAMIHTYIKIEDISHCIDAKNFNHTPPHSKSADPNGLIPLTYVHLPRRHQQW